MRKFLSALTLMLALASVHTAMGKTPYMTSEELQSESRRGFEEILDLWRDGRFEELYNRTMAGGRTSKEQFAKKLASAERKPACCWEKMQEVKVSVKNDSTVTLRAKVGFEGGQAGTDYTTRSFRLQKEDGVWCISQSDILSLAGAAGKKTHHRTKKAKESNP